MSPFSRDSGTFFQILGKLTEMMKGNFEGLEEILLEMLPILTSHVKQQRKRLGGDMALAHAVFSRTQREKVAELLDGEVSPMATTLFV